MTLNAIQQCFATMHQNYYTYEWSWALDKLEEQWGCSVSEVTLEQLQHTIAQWQEAVIGLDKMVYEDAKKEFNLNSQTGFGVDGDASQRKADFESVRGSFESNPFVLEILAHIEGKTALGEILQASLDQLH